MVEKKNYVKPQVESEEAMEQTSLACTSTMFPLQYDAACDWGTNLEVIAVCDRVPWKGGNLVDFWGCSAFPFDERDCVVALS